MASLFKKKLKLTHLNFVSAYISCLYVCMYVCMYVKIYISGKTGTKSDIMKICQYIKTGGLQKMILLFANIKCFGF